MLCLEHAIWDRLVLLGILVAIILMDAQKVGSIQDWMILFLFTKGRVIQLVQIDIIANKMEIAQIEDTTQIQQYHQNMNLEIALM
jgi:hypothetical protein